MAPHVQIASQFENAPLRSDRFPEGSSASVLEYCIHGIPIRIRSELPEVAAVLSRRLSYFRVPECEPAVTFDFRVAADAEIAGIGCPDETGRRLMREASADVFYYSKADLFHINYLDRIKVLGSQDLVQVWIARSERESLWRVTHPMFTLPFVDGLQRRGRFCLHAAGLAVDGRGFLFPGASGAGKSTLTLALLRSGFAFLGDDMVVLSADGDRLRLLPFPEAIDVTEGTAGMFPELRPLLQTPLDPCWPKRQVCANQLYGGSPVTECVPAAVVFPRVAHAEHSTLEAIPPAEAFQQLAANVLLTEGRAAQAHFDALARLVKQVPCFRLHTGRDLDVLPALLREQCS